MITDRLVTIRISSVYGTLRAYPVNVDAKLFARLLNAQTLTPEALNIIARLGYTVQEVAQPGTLANYLNLKVTS